MKSQGYVGRFIKAMYGTRTAPQVWQEVVRKVMSRLDFDAILKFPCVYYNCKRCVKVVTRVDDFLCTGMKSDKRWLLSELEKEFALTS